MDQYLIFSENDSHFHSFCKGIPNFHVPLYVNKIDVYFKTQLLLLLLFKNLGLFLFYSTDMQKQIAVK